MITLKELQSRNKELPLYDVFSPAFAPYGQVLAVKDGAELAKALDKTDIPARGNAYVPSEAGLEATADAAQLSKTVYGGMAIQAGYCNGRGFALNAEEYHKCSEVNFTTTGLVLLLALPSDMEGRTLDSKKVVGFYLPPMTMVEIYPRVLHFAPCRVKEEGFRCLVVLLRGTNEPLEQPDTAAPGEEALLWMKNKWLLCHKDSPQAGQGAFVGITGKNLTLSLE